MSCPKSDHWSTCDGRERVESRVDTDVRGRVFIVDEWWLVLQERLRRSNAGRVACTGKFASDGICRSLSVLGSTSLGVLSGEPRKDIKTGESLEGEEGSEELPPPVSKASK